MTTKPKSVFQSAQDEWPEDEALLTHEAFVQRREGGYTTEENAEALKKDVAHMHRVFSSESDAADLIKRYDARLAYLM